VTVRKWTTRWTERHPDIPLEVLPVSEDDGVAAVRDGRADVAFVRLPLASREALSVIRLYGEVQVLVVPREHELASRESVTAGVVAALDGNGGYPTAGPVKDAVELVAAGVGSLTLPHAIARLTARKDVAAIPIEDAAETEVAIIWLADETTDEIEEFVGIVRGRTAASSRANPTPPMVRERPAKPAVQQKPRGRRVAPKRRRQGR
jgi:DNA-binding transcriptional LysR family regulator